MLNYYYDKQNNKVITNLTDEELEELLEDLTLTLTDIEEVKK